MRPGHWPPRCADKHPDQLRQSPGQLSQEFVAFLRKVDAEIPDELDCYVVLENASTHKTSSVKPWLTNHPRFVLHFTATSSSWFNLVEHWFVELTSKELHHGTDTSVRPLNNDIRAWGNNPTYRRDQDRRPNPWPASPTTAPELTTQA